MKKVKTAVKMHKLRPNMFLTSINEGVDSAVVANNATKVWVKLNLGTSWRVKTLFSY